MTKPVVKLANYAKILVVKINNMAFKLKSSEKLLLRKVDMEDGVLGKANRDGTIDINKNS